MSNRRYEIKFVLDGARLNEAMNWIYNNTTAVKKYNKRVVNSIYFDDIEYSSVRDNLAGISERSKFRLRWYDDKYEGAPMFEIKVREGRLGYKKLYKINSLKGKNLQDIDFDKITFKCVEDLMTQNVFLDNYLIPTLRVSYEREYYETYDGIRITIDGNIKFSDAHLHCKIDENISLPYLFKVMEVKFPPKLKDTVSELIRPLHMTNKRHSKYLIGMSMLGYSVYI
jgi:SPX domain protein involved in polyphosphate accumulation